MDVVIATARSLPAPDADLPLLVPALQRLGLSVDVQPWDAAFDWSSARLVVIRSTWDYHHRRDAFLAWTLQVSAQTRLLNPAEVVAWNTRKTYLRELEQRGVPVVPTVWVERGSSVDVAALARAQGWTDAVVKPSISAGADRTVRFRPQEPARAQQLAETILQGCELMVQPYVNTVEGRGERSLLYCDRAFSHAVRKQPALAPDGQPNAPVSSVDAEPDELAVAEKILAAVPHELLYARVDTLRDGDGTVRLMELEITEPALFLPLAPGASERFAEAIARRLR